MTKKLLKDGGYIVSNKNKTVYYDQDGNKHREDGPAVIIMADEKQVLEYHHYIHGVLHNKKGSAVVIFHSKNKIAEMFWFDNGMCTKAQQFDIDNNLVRETILIDNKDLLYKTTYYKKDSSIEVIAFTKDGKFHREDGPAYIDYYEDCTYFFLQGEEYNELEYYTLGVAK